MNDYQYIYFDSEEDRKRFIVEMTGIRDKVIAKLEQMPEEEWYIPRYHGWTPAAMLAHLNTRDTLGLWHIKLGLLGIRPQISKARLKSFNDFTANIFKNRVMESSIKGTRKNTGKIADFVEHLPVDRFSIQVFYPGHDRPITIEKAIQEHFLNHWRLHFQTMAEVDAQLNSIQQE